MRTAVLFFWVVTTCGLIRTYQHLEKCTTSTFNPENIIIANKSFENVAKFIYLEMTVTNQINVHEEMKNRLNSRSAWCLCISEFFVLPFAVIHIIVILPVDFY
jgi:hypothetical protein